RRVDAELDAAGDDHVLAEEALDFTRAENALLDRLRSEAQQVLDAMVACVLAQIAAAVPEDAREAARLADEKARIARPERIGVAVAVEHRCRHDVHHAVARIAHAADAPPRNELAVQADADASRVPSVLEDVAPQREAARRAAEHRVVWQPFRRQVA